MLQRAASKDDCCPAPDVGPEKLQVLLCIGQQHPLLLVRKREWECGSLHLRFGGITLKIGPSGEKVRGVLRCQLPCACTRFVKTGERELAKGESKMSGMGTFECVKQRRKKCDFAGPA